MLRCAGLLLWSVLKDFQNKGPVIAQACEMAAVLRQSRPLSVGNNNTGWFVLGSRTGLVVWQNSGAIIMHYDDVAVVVMQETMQQILRD